jgi:hypothetical protein
MRTLFRNILAIIIGIAVALVLVIAVEGFSAIVHPLPAEFNGSMGELCQHVARYPRWVLSVVVLAWSATAYLGTWTATKIGQLIPGMIVSVLLLWAVVFNVAMLPYPMSFKLVMPICLLIACYLGVNGASSPQK